jgi:micrococcal nuclease
VVGVVDGDTIKVRINGVKTTVRIIGIDTPELHKPGFAQACFAQPAASRMQSLVQSKPVRLQADPTQENVDRYGRLLRHVLLPDDRSVAGMLIREGFGREYTYDAPYAGQSAYRAAQVAAKAAGAGLWTECGGFPTAVPLPPKTTAAPAPQTSKVPLTRDAPPPWTSEQAPPEQQSSACDIKGNINGKGEKIYHTRGSRSYAATKITESKGERWFCSTAEAEAAGWRAPRG